MTIETRERKDLTFTVLERAVLYARTSGDDTDRDSLTDQLSICEAYAAGKQYQILASLQEDVTGVSGADWAAEKLNKAMAMAQAGEFDVLIVRDAKRFSRDIERAVTFDSQFRRYGVRIEYVWNPELNGKVDATTKLLKLIRYWEGESDRIDTVKRLYNGRKKALRQKQSVIVAGRAPYGYRVVEKPEDKTASTLEIVDTEAQWVRQIFDWFTVEKLSYHKIVKRLKEYQVPTPTEAKHRLSIRKTAGRCEWSKETIRYLLGNETYIGQWSYGKKTKRNERKRLKSLIPDDLLQAPAVVGVPAIIEGATFAIAKQRLEDLRELGQRRNTNREYLLQGRLFCDICGARGVVSGKVVNGKEYLYYLCGNCKRAHKSQRCALPSFPAQKVDTAVWGWVRGLLLDENEVEKSYQLHLKRAKEQAGPVVDQLRQIESDTAEYTAELDAQLAALKELPQAARRARAAIMLDIERLEGLLDRLETRQEKLKSEVEAPEDIEARFATLRQFRADLQEGAILAEDNFDARRQIIEALNVTITMRVSGKTKLVDARAEFTEVATTLDFAGSERPTFGITPGSCLGYRRRPTWG